MYVWVGTGGSGTGVFISTQRTTPYGITGYNTSVRRIGYILQTGGIIASFKQTGIGVERDYRFEYAITAFGSRVLSAGNATGWTGVVCSSVVPPTAQRAMGTVSLVGLAAANYQADLRARNTGTTDTSRPFVLNSLTTNTISNWGNIALDDAQCFDYLVTNANLTVYVDIYGCIEVL